MKKWEEQNQKKLHQKKLQDVKSTLPSINQNKPTVDPRSTASTLRSHPFSNHTGLYACQGRSISQGSHYSQISNYFDFEKNDLAQIPLYRLLKHYTLQQYAKVSPLL